MNRHQRRAEAVERRTRNTKFDKAAALRLAMISLAHAGPTATGATVMHPDGTMTYLSAADARALYGAKPARGHA